MGEILPCHDATAREPEPKRAENGFTLIELIVAMAVLAILSAVAIPSYSGYLTRSQLTDATGTLGAYRLRMEQSYQDNGNFGAAACSVATANTTTWDFQCALTGAGQGFTVTATGKGRTAGYQYSIDEQGSRRTLAFPGVGASACWVIRAGICS